MGFDPDWLLDLDVLSFESLVTTATEEAAEQRSEAFYDATLAAQGDEKAIKKHAKALRKAFQHRDPTVKTGKDLRRAMGQ